MTEVAQGAEFAALQKVITALQELDDEARQRIFETAATFFRLEGNSFSPAHRPQPVRDIGSSAPAYPSFSEGTPMSPKEFLFQKQPRSDVERIDGLLLGLPGILLFERVRHIEGRARHLQVEMLGGSKCGRRPQALSQTLRE